MEILNKKAFQLNHERPSNKYHYFYIQARSINPTATTQHIIMLQLYFFFSGYNFSLVRQI
ncbi:hypothetical protein B0A75_13640 [Flavobacterium oncorhynchi]|uniref:Uncharacterized protein n=1 Tax=Flavobacterium oncorhynchi TaxID=728056 RepID=A0A226HX74_9FLAO|nr:hypothetical protein B0A75_13640 [Flavobacterium oncorhynchi]